MTESKATKKFHPSPAKSQFKNPKSGRQTDGLNRDLAGTARTSPTVDVIKEQQKTELGYSGRPKARKSK